MDELDLLRSHWKNNGDRFKKIPRTELYSMLHKKSSSIVWWMLIISFLEFIFWLIVPLFSGDEKDDPVTHAMNRLDMDYVLEPMSYLSYGIMAFFFFAFYINYRKIKVTDNAKTLMANIVRVRKTATLYINISLALIIARALFMSFVYFTKDAGMTALFDKAAAHGKLFIMGIIATVLVLVSVGILACLVWLYYRVIYGLLLKKLFVNYQDLKKIED